MEELSHGIVECWLDSMADTHEADIPSRVEEALATVTFEYIRSDPRGCTLAFFTEVFTRLKEYGCSSVIKPAGKELARQTLPKIQTKGVREVLDREWRFWSARDKSDFKKFHKHVLASMIEASKWTGKRTQDSSGNAVNQEGQKSKKLRVANEARRKRLSDKKGDDKGIAAGSRAEKSKGKPKSRKQEDDWEHPCLNPACKLKHRVRDCPDTSEELKKNLLDQYYEKKRLGGKAGAVVLKGADGKLAEATGDGGWSACVGDSTSAVALPGHPVGDIGADFSCIPRSLVGSVLQDGAKPVEEKLKSRVYLEAAVQNTTITANSVIRADLTLELNCGPLKLRNTEFLVVEQGMSELLLGRPLLKAIGFDLEDHLDTNRDVLHNTEFETNLLGTLNSRSGGTFKAARSSYAASIR